jgi:phosphoenolpyruvate carboxykinase (GTP)
LAIARDGGWRAEHVRISTVTSPTGESRYIAGAFSSACGTTILVLLVLTLSGWNVEAIGDDICWMKVGPEGTVRAINPEDGFFGVALGTNAASNPDARAMRSSNTVFANTARTADGDEWWEGLTDETPEHLVDGHANSDDPRSSAPAAHPNSRVATPLAHGSVAPEWVDPAGVPGAAVFFEGRRASAVSLVFEASGWADGVFLGSTMASEVTAAATGAVGKLRRETFALLSFCGDHMADYFAHWLSFAERTVPEKLPWIDSVNWLRTGTDGRSLWPGFGENSRVLARIVERCAGRAAAGETPIGILPAPGALDLSGLEIAEAQLATLLDVEATEWRSEPDAFRAHDATFGGGLPSALGDQLDALAARLEASTLSATLPPPAQHSRANPPSGRKHDG